MLTIGKLAKRVGVSTDSIRFYERLGLIAAVNKTTSGYRLYGEDTARQLTFIKHAQRCGFTLPEIRELLLSDSKEHAGSVRQLALKKRTEIEETIAALHTMHAALCSYLDSAAENVPFSAIELAAHEPFVATALNA